MELYSTNNENLRVSFKGAVFNSLPVDKGLYMLPQIPRLSNHFISNLQQYSLPEIAFEIARTLIGDVIPEADLKRIADAAINFDSPLQLLPPDTAVLEL